MAGRTRTFAWSPVRSLMKSCGAEIVARDAVDSLLRYLEDRAKELTDMALNFTKHAGRKKVTKDDLRIAYKYF